MTPNDVAFQSFQFWTGAIPGVIRPYGKLQAYAWLAMEDGEVSFRYPFPVGDHGKAHGPFQNQQIRIDAIKAGCGIDVSDPNLTNIDGLRAADWETTSAPGYRRIRPILEVLTTLEGCVVALVMGFEQSANQPRDIMRRFSLATYWQGQFQ